MARLWWTLDPSKYYLRQKASGGRNEVLFAVLGCVFGSAYFQCRRSRTHFRRFVNDQSLWHRTTTLDGKQLSVSRNLA